MDGDLPSLTVELHRPFDGNSRQLFRDRVVGDGDPIVAATISREAWLRLGRPSRVQVSITALTTAEPEDEDESKATRWAPSETVIEAVLVELDPVEPRTRQELEERTGLSAASVRRAVEVLEARERARCTSGNRPSRFSPARYVRITKEPAPDDPALDLGVDGDLSSLDPWAPESKASA